MKGELTIKQKAFAENMLKGMTQEDAYKKAGYAATGGAAVNACNLLKNPKIQAYIRKRQKKAEKKADITQERILKELAKVAFMDASKLVNEEDELKSPHELDENLKGAIVGIEDGQWGRKIKLSNKLTALELLAKTMGMFKDNANVNGVVILKPAHIQKPKNAGT